MIKVTAGIIRKDNKVLIAQRAKGKSLELKWEFPGGKIEAGETPQQCLARELKEELDVEVTVKELICITQHAYSDFKVELHAYEVDLTQDKIMAVEHEAIKWVNISELDHIDFVAADLEIVHKLKELKCNMK